MSTKAHPRKKSPSAYDQVVDRFWASLLLFTPIVLAPTLGMVIGLPYAWPAVVPLALGAAALVWSLTPVATQAREWVVRRPRSALVTSLETSATRLAALSTSSPALSTSGVFRHGSFRG